LIVCFRRRPWSYPFKFQNRLRIPPSLAVHLQPPLFLPPSLPAPRLSIFTFERPKAVASVTKRELHSPPLSLPSDMSDYDEMTSSFLYPPDLFLSDDCFYATIRRRTSDSPRLQFPSLRSSNFSFSPTIVTPTLSQIFLTRRVF